MTSFDTNIVVHAANEDSSHFEKAREFLVDLRMREDVVVCELMLVEVYLKLCNERIFRHPLNPEQAAGWCDRLRRNRNWRVVESALVMDEVWGRAGSRNFAFRRIIDIRLGLTLRAAGVDQFATTNVKDFQGLGFSRVWNPLAG